MEEKKSETNEDIVNEMSRVDWNSVTPNDAETFGRASFALTDSLQKMMTATAIKRSRMHFIIAIVAASLLMTTHLVSANVALVLLIVLSCVMWLESKGRETLAANDSRVAADEVARIVRPLPKK